MFTIGAYMRSVARDRAADRGCTGGGKVAGRRRPARRNSRRVFVFAPAPAHLVASHQRMGWNSANSSRSVSPYGGSLNHHYAAVIEPQERRRRLTLDAAGLVRGELMLILKYFLVVGAVLTAGLIALYAHFLPAGLVTPAKVHSATSASLPTVAPKAQPPEPELAVQQAVTPPKEASPPRRSQRSARAQRRAH